MSVAKPARHRYLTRNRALTAAGAAAVTAAVAAGSMVSAAAAEAPTVTLTVDGRTSSFTTTDETVGAVLAERDVTVDPNDLVTPTPTTGVTDGTDITVDHRVHVTLTTSDGARESHLVEAENVAQLKNELDLPSLDATLMRQSAHRPSAWQRTLVVRPGGHRISGSQALVDGTRAQVYDVRVGFRTTTKRVHPKPRTHRTPLLSSGTKQVKQRGHAGRVTLTMRSKFVNGALVGRNVVHRKVHRKAQARVVLMGTGPNWRGLAQCESGNNPRAVNPAGYYGLYQFSLSTWANVGGHGNPIDASRLEQTKRAWILYKRAGSSPWPVCGAYL